MSKASSRPISPTRTPFSVIAPMCGAIECGANPPPPAIACWPTKTIPKRFAAHRLPGFARKVRTPEHARVRGQIHDEQVRLALPAVVLILDDDLVDAELVRRVADGHDVRCDERSTLRPPLLGAVVHRFPVRRRNARRAFHVAEDLELLPCSLHAVLTPVVARAVS
jgi:hypothetical protein